MEDQLYLRSTELIVGTKVGPTPQEPFNARLFRNRLNFTVTKEQNGTSNKAKITIFNINQDSRNFLEEKDLVVFLKAGYQDQVSTIFFGDIIERTTQRAGADVTTTLECGDQEQLLKTVRVNIGLAANSTNIQAFDAAATALGLKIPAPQKALIPVTTFLKRFSFVGLAQDLLNKLTETNKFKWSIQDGVLQILGPESDDTQLAVVIGPNTGLIGNPTKTKDGIKFRSLLNPQITVGRTCKIESTQFQGRFGNEANKKASQSLSDAGGFIIARKVVHQGDSNEGAWETVVEGQVAGENV